MRIEYNNEQPTYIFTIEDLKVDESIEKELTTDINEIKMVHYKNPDVQKKYEELVESYKKHISNNKLM